MAAQVDRRSIRNYHRPFYGIDFEGHDFPGFDEVDATFHSNVALAKRMGLPEPQMRGLDGRGNTPRKPSRAGIGDPTEGEECPPFFLHRDDEGPNHSDEIIEWLLSLPGEIEAKKIFPDGVNFVSYAFTYDATQFIADLPKDKIWEITKKRIQRNGRKTKYPTLYKDYAIDFLKGKWLKLWKLRDHNKPYKEKLDKYGNVKLKANGKPEMEIDAIAYIGIDDAFGFYQSAFTKATKPLADQKYVNKKDHETITYMKEHRDEFDNMSPDEIKHYCHLELVFLSKALTVLRDAAYEERVKQATAKGLQRPSRRGLKLRTWGGAGAAAGAKIRHEH